MATPPRPERAPLNIEKEEREIGNVEITLTQNTPEQSTVVEIKEKLTKPTLGVSLVVFLIINSIMFFVGVTTTNDCTIKPIIPIYLAVAGAIGIITKVMPIANRNKRIVLIDRIVLALFVIEFIWMILGTVWIYSIYKPNYDPLAGLYCNKTAYLLAFWLLTLHYICLILAIVIPCCIGCCFLCVAAVAVANE